MQIYFAKAFVRYVCAVRFDNHWCTTVSPEIVNLYSECGNCASHRGAVVFCDPEAARPTQLTGPPLAEGNRIPVFRTLGHYLRLMKPLSRYAPPTPGPDTLMLSAREARPLQMQGPRCPLEPTLLKQFDPSALPSPNASRTVKQ